MHCVSLFLNCWGRILAKFWRILVNSKGLIIVLSISRSAEVRFKVIKLYFKHFTKNKFIFQELHLLRGLCWRDFGLVVHWHAVNGAEKLKLKICSKFRQTNISRWLKVLNLTPTIQFSNISPTIGFCCSKFSV